MSGQGEHHGLIPPLNRRQFLKGASLLGSGLAVSGWGLSPWIGNVFYRRGTYVYPDRPPTWPGVATRYSVCKQCGSDCGLAAHVYDGVLQKLDGNPYHPAATEPQAPYATPVSSAAVWAAPHSLCPRGQAGRQTLYDPYRVIVPLKRTGPRGAGRWQTISWEQLIREVTAGGYLFSRVPGEGTRHVDGFGALWQGGTGRLTPLDPAYPEYGPLTNGLAVYYGGAENGQTDFINRFAASFGTVNVEAADAICDLNRMQATMQSLDGMTDPLKPDVVNAEFIVWFGANVLEAHFPMQALGRKVAEATSSGRLKYWVVDVRGGNALLHADRWIGVKPGGDGALAMGAIRWIIEHNAYDGSYLAAPNAKAAQAAGEPTFSNASWLVVADSAHPRFGQFLTTSDAGLGMVSADGGMGAATSGNVVLGPKQVPLGADTAVRGTLWPQGPLNTEPTMVNGVACRTALQWLYLEARRFNLAEYAAAAGVSVSTIQDLASEFTRHGKRAVADYGRGPTMHTNGFDAGRAIMTLNLLIGNVDWAGGYVMGGGTADYTGTRAGAPYQLGSWPRQPAAVPAGIPISRSGATYEQTKLYQQIVQSGRSPYPAPRPWYPLGGGQWPEMFAGMYLGYPYACKILVQHMANPAWSMPAMAGADDPSLPWQQLISDTKKIPLYIAVDTVIAESTAYADYIVPDTTYLECWEFPGVWPVVPTTVQGVRWPVVDPLTSRTPQGAPMCLEQFLIDIALHLGMPGFGANAFLEGGSLAVREDYYLKMVANIAYDGSSFLSWQNGTVVAQGPVPDASAAELAAIRPLYQRHRSALSEAQWRKAAYVLARGGRFENYPAAYLPNPAAIARLNDLVQADVLDTGVPGWVTAAHQVTPADARRTMRELIAQGQGGDNPPWMAHTYGAGGMPCQIYNPTVAAMRSAITGLPFSGVARYQPPANIIGATLAAAAADGAYPLLLSTHKDTVSSKAYSVADPWLLEMMPEALVEISTTDANRLGLQNGQRVRVVSATHPRGMVGRVRVSQAIRPGVLTFAHGYGHWQYGAGKWVVDGSVFEGDPARGAPVRLNAVMAKDQSLGTAAGWATGLADPVAGGQAFYDTSVRIEKA